MVGQKQYLGGMRAILCASVVLLATVVLSACAHKDDVPYPRATHADRGEDKTLSPAAQKKAMADLDKYATERHKAVDEAIKKSGKKKK